MTIHVNIGEAKTRLSELVAAALRGEEVIVQRDGAPKIRLVPLPEAMAIDKAERRRAITALLAQIDALPVNRDPADPLEWDDAGLPS